MRRIDVPRALLLDRQPGDDLLLPDEQAHYLRDVLRLETGDEVELFDGEGTIVRGRLAAVGDEVRLKINKLRDSERGESPLTCVLFQAIPKGKRWKWILEKATELGVDSIVPLETKRTVVQIPKQRLKRRRKRWNKIVSSAARQSERTVVPTISDPLSIEEARKEPPRDIDLVAHPGGDAETPQQLLDAIDDPVDSVGIWIGPEGGFNEDEVQTMVDAGMSRISLGPRILRADTAGIAALALVQAARGDLGPGQAEISQSE